jgi:hypothetical protein
MSKVTLRVQRGLGVQRGLVDSTQDCCTAVPGSIPPPDTPTLRKILQEAQHRRFAQRRKNHPSEENLMRMNLVKYCIVKVEKK